jgi:rRNA maturation endonuclease Nob1
MSKDIEKKSCHYCESTYKLVYDYEETGTNPKFCPFCGEECYDEKDDELVFEEDDN